MTMFGATAVLLLLAGVCATAEGRPNFPTCPDHDKTKCRDAGNDCCIERGDFILEHYYCADGYVVKQTHGECTDWSWGRHNHREYSCVPWDSTCAEQYGDPTFVRSSCDVDDDDLQDWYDSILTGSIVGIVICVILVIIASLPACCGVMKEKNLCCPAVVIGIIAGLCFFIPLFAAMAASDQAVEDICDECHCEEDDKQEVKDHMGFWGAIVGYVAALGWAVVVLAGVTECLLCCWCCPCCGPLKTYKDSQKMTPVTNVAQGQVIGQPQQAYGPK